MRNIPCEGLEGGVCGIDLGADAQQAHEGVAVIAREILRRAASMEALESERHQFELRQNQVALVVVDELCIPISTSTSSIRTPTDQQHTCLATRASFFQTLAANWFFGTDMGASKSAPRTYTLMSLPAGASSTSGNVQMRWPHCCNIRSGVLILYMSFGGRPTAMTRAVAPRITSQMRYTWGVIVSQRFLSSSNFSHFSFPS
jgi:hypothetical protein